MINEEWIKAQLIGKRIAVHTEVADFEFTVADVYQDEDALEEYRNVATGNIPILPPPYILCDESDKVRVPLTFEQTRDFFAGKETAFEEIYISEPIIRLIDKDKQV
ncbi:MAG: hypothetical protein LUC22_01425 [Prevotella sp.]|nr:hypothetical protein [Prevotella sp.]